MREIKFRFYQKTHKQMCDWNYVKTYKMVALEDNQDGESYSPWMQYTGLKDKNGKEIYEGDILKVPDWYDLPENTSMTYNNQVVTFENCSFDLGGTPMFEDYEYISEECEIIGNIYENPELLIK